MSVHMAQYTDARLMNPMEKKSEHIGQVNMWRYL